MKTNYLTRIAAAVAIPTMAILSGCQSDTGLELSGSIKIGHQQATLLPDESQTPVGQAIFKTDTQPYDKSEVTNEGIRNSQLWKHYQNKTD